MSNLRIKYKKLKRKVERLESMPIPVVYKSVKPIKLNVAMEVSENIPEDYVVEQLAREYTKSPEFIGLVKANMTLERHPYMFLNLYRTHLDLLPSTSTPKIKVYPSNWV